MGTSSTPLATSRKAFSLSGDSNTALCRRGSCGIGNGRYDEAEEPQQTLFSWAEFMAQELVKPKGRKAQAPSLSLFEWAVEQEREAEPVGAGR